MKHSEPSLGAKSLAAELCSVECARGLSLRKE